MKDLLLYLFLGGDAHLIGPCLKAGKHGVVFAVVVSRLAVMGTLGFLFGRIEGWW